MTENEERMFHAESILRNLANKFDEVGMPLAEFEDFLEKLDLAKLNVDQLIALKYVMHLGDMLDVGPRAK